MIFSNKTLYGREFFYPIDKNAILLVESFPSSSGKRKCLTLAQFQLLNYLGLHPKIKPQPYMLEEEIPKRKRGAKKNDKSGTYNRIQSI